MDLIQKVNTKILLFLEKFKKNALLTLFIIGFLVYANSFLNGFVLDDVNQILGNSAVHSISNIPTLFTGSTFSDGASTLRGNYYKPVMTLVYTIIYSTFGPIAFPFHLVQLILFILNAWLLYKLLCKWFSKNLSFFASMLFLVHPLNSEAVLYISSLQDVLFMFFGLLALLIFIHKPFNRFNLLSTFILLFMSILSKETGVLFFAVLLLYQYLYEKKYLRLSIVISFFTGIFYLFLKYFIAGISLTVNPFATITRLKLDQRLLQIPAILEFYFKTFFFPKDLIAVQNWVVGSITFYTFYFPLIICLSVALFIASLFLIFKTIEIRKKLTFFSVWLILGLLLHLQIQPLDATVADRWFYFPMIGLVGIILIIFEKIRFKKKYFQILLLATVFILLALSLRSFLRTFDYRNEYALASHDLAFQPDNFVLQNSLGLQFQSRGNLNEAKIHFEKAIQIDPGNNMAWHNLGFLYEQEGAKNNSQSLYKLADNYYQKAINTGGDPNSYINLAELRLFKENFNLLKTDKFLEVSLNKFPNNPKLLLMHSITLYKLGNKNRALKEISKAIKIQPQNSQLIQIYQWIINNQQINLTP